MASSKYDAVRSHIDFVRQSLREISDDSNFTDEQIYYALLVIRGMILERALKKGKQLPIGMYQTLCYELCEATYAECQACMTIPTDCYVLKTTVDFPTALWTGSAEAMRVATISGQEIAPLNEESHKNRKYRKTGHNNFYYVRMNDRIAVLNVPMNRLKGIKITAIFEDPITAALDSKCESDCSSVLDASFQISMGTRISVYTETMKFLLNTDKLPEDRSNDAGSDVQQQKI